MANSPLIRFPIIIPNREIKDKLVNLPNIKN